MSVELHVIIADWSTHKAELQHIREVVFIDEQQVPREIEWDGEDEASTHFLAVNELGQYLGCARLLPSGQIGRMAVLAEHRGTGIGAKLLRAAVEEGKAQGFDKLFLHAQSYAEEFYRKGGFLPFGDQFDEAGIPHISMELKLPVTFTSPDIEASTGPAIRPQEVRQALQQPASQAHQFEGFSECSEELARIVDCAQRRLLILSPYLDHELFDRQTIADAISTLARSAPKVEVRILIFDSKPLVDRGHRLMNLARRLDDKIKIRVLSERPDSRSSAFVCADLDAYWLLPSYDIHAGVADTGNPVTCRRLAETFENAWKKAKDDIELRTLKL